MPKLIIVRGLPGSGKSTYAKKYAQDGYIHLEADQYFINDKGEYHYDVTQIRKAHKYVYDNLEKAIKDKENVIVSNTSIERWEIDKLLSYVANDDDYDVKIVRMETYYGSTHNIPSTKMNLMYSKLYKHPNETVIEGDTKFETLGLNLKRDLPIYVKNSTNIKVRDTQYDNLKILKYNNSVFYHDKWDELNVEARGLIVDEDYNIVSRPFKKIFNYGIEKNAPIIPLDKKIYAIQKVNGFLGVVTWSDKHGLIYSTTGSTTSDFAKLFEKVVNETVDMEVFTRTLKWNDQYTYMFEVAHPSDPHIIPTEQGLYYLGKRHKETGDFRFLENERPDPTNIKVPFIMTTTMEHIIELVKYVKHEGYVIYDYYVNPTIMTKIKSPYYLINKLYARRVNLATIKKEDIDEEYYPLWDYVQKDLNWFISLNEQERLNFTRNFINEMLNKKENV